MVVPPKKWNNKRGTGSYWTLKASLMRTHSNLQLKALKKSNIEPILNALDYLGNVPWRINVQILDIVDFLWDKKIKVEGLPTESSILYKEVPLKDDENFQKIRMLNKNIKANNADLHSLKCDMSIKLNIAKKFRDEKIYFPYSIDFRGRGNNFKLDYKCICGINFFLKPTPFHQT
jgi:DNA-directed RNA polymerase